MRQPTWVPTARQFFLLFSTLLSFTAGAGLAPTQLQLSTALSQSEIVTLPLFNDLPDRIAEAEAEPRAGQLLGLNRTVNLGPDNFSRQPLNNGNFLYRLALQSPDASSIGLRFLQFALKNNEQLWLYAPDSNHALGPFQANHANQYGHFWTPLISGDSVVIEVESPSPQTPELAIDLITHGINNEWNRSSEQRSGDIEFKAAGACNVNVACNTARGHETKVRATARIVYRTVTTAFFCSGTLLNNSEQDGRPYFLTANHCIDRDSEAASSTTYWEYQSGSCNSNQPLNSGQTVSGASLVATWPTSDFTLLELNNTPPAAFNPYWSGWDRSGNNLTSGISIHHPDGDVKKISVDSDPLSIRNGSVLPNDPTNPNGQYIFVEKWEVGTTEGGSSGAGIWTPNNHLVGQLSAGNASCDNPDGQDFFGWIGQSWEGGGTPASRLKDWLAPGNANITSLAGCDHHQQNCSGGGSEGGSGGGGSALQLLWLILLASLRPLSTRLRRA